MIGKNMTMGGSWNNDSKSIFVVNLKIKDSFIEMRKIDPNDTK